MSLSGVDFSGFQRLARGAEVVRVFGTRGMRAAVLTGAMICAGAIACAAQQDVQQIDRAPAAARAKRFLAGRTVPGRGSAAAAMAGARREHAALQAAQAATASARTAGAALPRLNPLSAPWTSVGPAQVLSQRYGTVTGRVTAIALDPTDATGNTVYIGTTGGGVWKSINAAGPAAGVTFSSLTDTLPVFSANAGTAVVPSLSIGALAVSPPGGTPILLAGTGDPNDATDSYYGEGILRSADGGNTWTLAQGSNDGVAGHHSFVGLGSAAFAWSTSVPGLVVAAMSQSAEGVLVNAPDGTYSIAGLYFSTDAGVTWQMASVVDGNQFVQRPSIGAAGGSNAATAVVWNPVRQRFYAALRAHGYYESPDGQAWTRVVHQPGTGLTQAACPSVPGAVTPASCPIFRGALAVQPTTGDTFALTVDAYNQDQGLWQDVCAKAGSACAVTPIAFGTRLPSTALEAGSGSTAIAQADYDLTLAAVPSGTDTLLLAGTVDLYRCTLAGGCALRNTTNTLNGCNAPARVAPAQHALGVLAGAGSGGLPLVYLGNDGGVWRSTDGINQQQTPCSADDAAHFDNLNPGLGSLAEVVSFAQHPSDASTLLAGLGANGAAATSGTAAGAAWTQLSAGEGGIVAIDQTNPQNWYVSTAAGVNVRFCGKGAACAAADFTGAPTLGATQVSGDAAALDAPFLLDPALPTNLLLGTCRAWRGAAQSSTGWPGGNAISTPLGGTQNAVCSAATNGLVRSLAAAGPASGATAPMDAGSTVLYAGMAGAQDGGGIVGGHVFANLAAGSAGSTTVWTDAAHGTVTNDVADAGKFNPGGFDIASVVADTHDATGKTVYVTVMGFTGNTINVPHVYRSIDGGAHWLNISANLPNAPANALLVDPNDANTVYLAMDTGVYVTTNVTNCATANCWSVFGTGLPNAPAVALAASASIATGDGRFGELRVGTYGRGLWQVPLLTAAYPAAPVMSVTPVSLTFAVQAEGTASAAQPVTVTNAGNAPLSVTSIVAGGDFHETDTCVGTPVAPAASCTVQVNFLPTATGPRNGILTVYGNVAGGQATVALTGTGTPPAAVVLTPITLTFSGTNVGSSSAAQNITISNTGGVPASLGTVAITGDFRLSANTCGTSLPASTGCTVSVVFAPSASGTRTGVLTVSGSSGTQTASLTGSGLLGATDALTPLALTFPQQQLNTASPTQTVTLTNAGDVALTLIAASIASGDFTVVNGCGNSLNGHASCTLQVAFVPKSVGTQTGVLTVADQFRSQAVALSGTGVAPPGVSVSPYAGMTFAATGLGGTSASQTLTLTNNGGLPLTIASISVTGDFSIAPGTNTCGASLAPGSVCTAQIVFTPAAGGARTGTLTAVDNAANSPQTLALTGTGIDFALQPNGPTSVTVTAGTSAMYPLLVSSAAGVPGTVALTCTGAPAHATCLVNPASVALGGTVTATATVQTNVAELRWPGAPQTVWLAGLLPLGLLALRRRRASLLLGLLLLAGCGASRVIPATESTSPGAPVSPNPTPTGTYNLIVTATSAGLTRTVALTLVVQ